MSSTLHGFVLGEEPLHQRIDQELAAAHPGGDAPLASDADFLRRAYLVLTGCIPTSAQTRAFFADPSAEKRTILIDQLIASREFAHWMAVRFDLMLMERRAEKHTKNAPWQQFLEESFLANKPWTQLVRELFAPDGADEKTRPIARWVLEREADPHALTRDVGRIFLGRDMACAQCHDHPRIADYVQRDYYGIEAFFSRTYLFQPDPNKPALLGERADGEAAWASVFTKVSGNTLPRLPGDAEIADQPVAPNEVWTVAPNDKDKNVRPIPKFSRRAQLAAVLCDGHHPASRRNIANRLWGFVFGRGLVDPPDLLHSANPPSNPPLLDVLADGIAALNFDMKAFVRELALTAAFQRSLDFADPAPEIALTAADRLPRLEQEAKALAETAGTSQQRCEEARRGLLQAQRACEPILAELKKQEAGVAEAKKAVDAALAEQKKADDALTAKREAQRSLAEAAAKSAEAATKVPDAPELAQAAKTFQGKAEQANSEIASLEKTAAGKKTDVETKSQALTVTQQTSAQTRAKLDEANRVIAGLQKALDEAAARKQADEIKARYAARVAGEAKSFVTWATLAAEDRSTREAALQSEAAFASTRRMVDRLHHDITDGPAKLVTLQETVNTATAALAKARDSVGERRPIAATVSEAATKTAEAAAKLPKDAELQAAAAAVKAKADVLTKEVAALDRTGAENQQKAERATKTIAETQARMEKAKADLPYVEQELAPLEQQAKIAAAKAEPGVRAREALSTAWSESFASATLVPLLPEQLCWSAMQATGILGELRKEATAEWDKKNPPAEADKNDAAKQAARLGGIENLFREKLRPHEGQYIRAFGGGPGQPQTDFFATPEQSLYFENAGVLRSWAAGLSAGLAKLNEPQGIAEELYLSVLTRLPSEAEIAELTSMLSSRPPEKKNEVVTDLAWALVTSVEFRFIH